jgi:hypothetical protein
VNIPRHSLGPRSRRSIRHSTRSETIASRPPLPRVKVLSPEKLGPSRSPGAADAGGAFCRPSTSRRYSNRGESDPRLDPKPSPQMMFGGRSRPACSVGVCLKRQRQSRHRAGPIFNAQERCDVAVYCAGMSTSTHASDRSST